MKTWLHLLVLLAVACSSGFGETCPRTIPIVFENREYQIEHDVELSGLQVRVGGKRVPARSLAVNREPIRIVVLLDVSGSMTHPRAKWLHISNLVGHIRQQMAEHADIAVATFSINMEVKIPFGVNEAEFVQRLNELISDPHPSPKKNARTGLWDAVAAARMMLQPARGGDVIFAITDGGDNNSKIKPTQARDDLSADGIRLFSFVVSEATPATAGEFRGPEAVMEETRATGGDAAVLQLGRDYWGPSQDVLARTHEAASRLYVRITDFYWLEVEAGRMLEKKRLRIEARSTDGQKRYAVAPREVFPCGN